MTDVFESVAIYKGTGYDAGAEGSPVRLKADEVTPSYFHVLRAHAHDGALCSPKTTRCFRRVSSSS